MRLVTDPGAILCDDLGSRAVAFLGDPAGPVGLVDLEWVSPLAAREPVAAKVPAVPYVDGAVG